MDAVNIAAMLTRFSEHWAPKKIAELNDYDVKIVKIQGDFTWHSHADTDELFLVIDGALTLQMRAGDVRLGPGELYVVPRGVEHCPRSEVETSMLLIEPRGVVNTVADLTVRRYPPAVRPLAPSAQAGHCQGP
jgi:mannose-6-phosphate isomerase-like protein (cupin superfamily)